jgi:Membrane dipeptidase (Peptidase family M19)
MDCCGHLHGSMHPAGIGGPALVSVEAMLAGEAGPAGSTAAARIAEGASAALDVLRRSISIDVHTHGGRTGITSKAPPSSDLANAMRAGSLAVACLADVPDMPVLGRSAEGALAMVRAPAAGELYRHHLDRLAWMDELVAHHGVRRALCAADLEEAHRAEQPAISHTALAGSPAMGPTPLTGRQISPDHARTIAETGGSIGIWHFFPSLDKYVDGIKEMADIVGVDHVSIGTDQFDARGCVEDYTRWVHLIAAMLRGGFTSEETGKIAGGNYMRIFGAAVG